jgi:polar amino acid transport system substrate-binding protein
MDYRPVFHDKKVRDDFNLGLAHIRATGAYQAIYDKYLKE